MILYRIRDWDKHYETHESRKYKMLSWVAMPIKLDGTGFNLLMRSPRGPAIFGCFLALVQVAGKSPGAPGESPARDGSLRRNGGSPHTARTLSAVIKMEEALIEETLTMLSEGDFDWIERVSPGESAGTPGKSPGLPEDAGKNPALPIPIQLQEPVLSERSGSQEQPSAREAAPPAAADAAEYFRLACADALGRPLDSAEDRTLAGTLMRRMAVGRIHPDIAARWARDFCERKAAAGDPVRGLKLLMHAWREDFGAWWKRVGAAYVGDRTHCVEQAVCAHCGDGIASFADGLVVPCACPPAESPPKRGLTKIAKPAKLSGRNA